MRPLERNVRRSAVRVSWSFHLKIDLTLNNAHDVAADPNSFVVLAQMDATDALQRGALRRDIRRLGESCTNEPLREAGIEAAGDRIFVTAAYERAHLEGSVMVGVIRTDYAQLEGASEVQSGLSESTWRAERSITAHQPGPLSTHWW